jgi:uncharacterized YigZ family protein
MSYPTAASKTEVELVVRKSRFIARLLPINCREDALHAVACARKDYPDARHHCWAYLLGEPADASNAGMNDDGEPSGTAGRPILTAMQHGDLGDIAIVVIRYFGGIKLGAGGLVRAYGQAARQVLDLAPRELRVPMLHMRIELDFAAEQALRHWLKSCEGELHSLNYAERVSAKLSLPVSLSTTFLDFAAAHNISITHKYGDTIPI